MNVVVSGCDRAGFRRTDWSQLGVAPLQVSQFHRDQRYLPAYDQDGKVLSRVFCGSADAILFEGVLAQLLQHCGRWPDPKSVVVMDNASFRYTHGPTDESSSFHHITRYLEVLHCMDLNDLNDLFIFDDINASIHESFIFESVIIPLL